MPKTTARGDVERSELPSTLQRSEEKAQRTFAEAHDAALEQYDGDEQRAYRVAYAALKHSYEKVGDHWEPKARRGPSDERAERAARTRGARPPKASMPTRPRSTCSASPGNWTSPVARG
jgi:cation transport regulator ChaB